MQRKNPCIAMVPTLGFSHLIQLIEFSKRLVVHHPHFHISSFIPTLVPPSPTTYSIVKSLPPHIDFTFLPQINMEDIKAQDAETQIYQTVTLSLPSLSQALSSLSSPTHLLVAMVLDFFSLDALHIAKELKLKSYVLYPTPTTLLSFFLHFPELDEDHEMVPTGFRELSQPLKLPGCISFQGKDLPDPVLERSNGAYKTILHACNQTRLLDGILVNSFIDLEREVVTPLQDSNHNNYPLIYHVGPIIQTPRSTNINESNSECLTWLGNQPRDSVLYVS